MEKIKGKTPNSPMNKLSINSHVSMPLKSTQDKRSIANSWEDEIVSPASETEFPLSPQAPERFPSAPPPTPISQTITQRHDLYPTLYNKNSDSARDISKTLPTTQAHDSFPYGKNSDYVRDICSERSVKRPEKTDAVAKRLIAGALGLKPPEKTEEQKAYEKAIREKEIKRISQEKEAKLKAQEEAERAKNAVWND
ncbi:hypothetical protein K3495_g4563 [Podosphaera aphanis]|nr:hypothetical protein K3495_g4563 [Podosphaera aphanis]